MYGLFVDVVTLPKGFVTVQRYVVGLPAKPTYEGVNVIEFCSVKQFGKLLLITLINDPVAVIKVSKE